MEKQLVADLVAKARVESSFAVRSASLAEFRNKPGHYLNLSLGDKTGDIAGRAWDNAEELAEVCQPGNVVWICGRVDEYQGKTQLIVDTAELVPASHVDPGDYLPTSTRDPLDMMDELDAVIETVEEPYLKALLHAFFADSTFRTKFAHGAGAKALHHSFVSGLLEHTLSVVMILRAVHDRHPQLDLDLLTAGAILHDVGKTTPTPDAFSAIRC